MNAAAKCQACGCDWRSHKHVSVKEPRGLCSMCGCKRYRAKRRIHLPGLTVKARRFEMCPACREGNCNCNGERCWRVVEDEPRDYVCLHNADSPTHHGFNHHVENADEIDRLTHA